MNNNKDSSEKGREGGCEGQGVEEDWKKTHNLNPMNQNKAPSPVKQTEDRMWLGTSEINF